jgi:hypothetical protein
LMTRINPQAAMAAKRDPILLPILI